MRRISILYEKPENYIVTAILQSMKYYYHPDVVFDIFTKKENAFLSHKLLKDWDHSIHNIVNIQNLDSLNKKTADFKALLCINEDDFRILNEKHEFDFYGTYYTEPHSQLEVLYCGNNSLVYEIVDIFLKQQKKNLSAYDDIVYLTMSEYLTNDDAIAISAFEKFNVPFKIASIVEFFGKPTSRKILLIVTPPAHLLPVMNLIYREFLLIYMLSTPSLVGLMNSDCHIHTPNTMVKNLRLVYDDILKKQSPDNENKYYLAQYSSFAEYYEKYTLSNKKYFAHWHTFIIEKYELIHKKPPATLLDIACGTATISKRIKKSFPEIQIDACDIAPEMLDNAKNCNNITLFQADMRTLRLIKLYDLVICTFDSVNYLRTEADFMNMLKSVWKCLKPKGILIFDVSTKKNSEENFNEITNYQDIYPGVILQRSIYSPQSSEQITLLQSFTESFHVYTHRSEVHVQKIWKCKKIVGMLQKAKFEIKGIYDAISQENLNYNEKSDFDNNYYRLFFVIQKR